jgi:hypothetical protein
MLPFLKAGTIASCFHKVENLCLDNLRLKINLRTGIKITEQSLKQKQGYNQVQHILMVTGFLRRC